MPAFEVVSPYQPAGDQPEAIAALAAGIENGLTEQTLLGVTGSGKTFTMAKIIEAVQKPTLVLAHNKTLAAQLCAEFKEFFPHNAVEYFVSYYDYYSPRPISPIPTPSSRRTRPQTTRSTGCGSRPPPPSWSAGMSSWSPPSPASTAWGSPTTTPR